MVQQQLTGLWVCEVGGAPLVLCWLRCLAGTCTVHRGPHGSGRRVLGGEGTPRAPPLLLAQTEGVGLGFCPLPELRSKQINSLELLGPLAR